MPEPKSISEALEMYGWHNGQHHIPDSEAITMATAAILANTPGPVGPESENSRQVQTALQALFEAAPFPPKMREELPDLDAFLKLPLDVRVDEINQYLNPFEATDWAERADSLIAHRAKLARRGERAEQARKDFQARQN